MDGSFRAPAMSAGDAVVTWVLESTNKSRTYQNKTLISADKYWPAGGLAMAGNIKIASNPENLYFLNSPLFAGAVYQGALSGAVVLHNVGVMQRVLRARGVAL